jgi:hypothetical protein
MKKILVTLAFLSFGIVVVNAQSAPKTPPAAAQDANGAQFKFKGGDTYDFGEIAERDEPYEHKFEFTNTGKQALIIQNATASCGCTTPEWPKQPILPGKSGVITVKYNSKGRVAPFMKDIWIQSNASPSGERYPLHIKGTVKGTGAASDKKAN